MTRAFLPHARDRLARRGRNAQHPCLDSSDRFVAVSHRNRSVPQKAIRLSEARCTLPRQATHLSRHLQHHAAPPLPPAVLKILVFASATHSTSAKIQRGAPRTVQADDFFNRDSHAFNNCRNAEHHAELGLRNFLRNAIAKACAYSPPLLCCAVRWLCLLSGTLSSNRQCSFRHFF
jgi:hypothetical protein